MRFPVEALMVAALAGLFTATWGAFKDAPYEGFSRASFVRSLVVSAAIVVVLWVLVGQRLAHLRLVEVFFVVMGIERIANEIYKPCFRREDQSKYLIPQNFSFFGWRVVSDPVLWTFGAASIAGVLGLARVGTPIASYPAHLVVACATGFFICLGGAGKDAPFEGFDAGRFLRSVKVLALVSPLFWVLGPTPLGLLVFMYGGLERLVVESYKTYFTGKRPGKFRGDLPIIDHAFLAWRPLLRALATVIVAAVMVLYVVAVV